MNVRNALARDNSPIRNARSRDYTTRRRTTAPGSQKRSWLPAADAVQDNDRREVVAQRFLSMNEAHDRIRTELLASRSTATS